TRRSCGRRPSGGSGPARRLAPAGSTPRTMTRSRSAAPFAGSRTATATATGVKTRSPRPTPRLTAPLTRPSRWLRAGGLGGRPGVLRQVQLTVEAVPFDELRVGAALDNSAIVDDQDLIRRLDGRQAVGDHQRGA